MDCRRRWAVDDDRSRKNWAVDEDRRRIRWAVDDDRRRRRWAVDDVRRRRRWEVDDYPPLQLPLQWRDPPSHYPHEDSRQRRRAVDLDRRRKALRVAQIEASLDRIDALFADFNHSLERVSTSVIQLSSDIYLYSLSHPDLTSKPDSSQTEPPLCFCDSDPLLVRFRNSLPDETILTATPHDHSPLPSLTRDLPEQLHTDFAYQEAHGMVLGKSNGSTSVVLQNSGEDASATIPATRRAFHSTVEEGKEEKEVVSKAKMPTEVASDGSDDGEAKENRICLQEIDATMRSKANGHCFSIYTNRLSGSSNVNGYCFDMQSDLELEKAAPDAIIEPHFRNPTLAIQLLPSAVLPALLATGSLPRNDLIGRGKDKEFVMQWWRKPSNEHPGIDLYRNISLLSMVGHGGMGKTTLLQHVYEDEMTEEFDLKMSMKDALRTFDGMLDRNVVDKLLERLKVVPDDESLSMEAQISLAVAGIASVVVAAHTTSVICSDPHQPPHGDKGDFSGCTNPTGLDSRDPFDLQPFVARKLYSRGNQDIFLRRKLEEQQKRLHAIVVNIMKLEKISSNSSDVQSILFQTISYLLDNEVVVLQDVRSKKMAINLMVNQLMGVSSESEIKEERKRIIAKIKNTIAIGQQKGGSIERSRVLGRLVEEENLNDNQIADFIINLLFDGNKITTKTMLFVTCFLTECPQALELLLIEHECIIRRIHNEILEWDDYRAILFNQCVIDETLKLEGIAIWLLRKAKANVDGKDFTIPQGYFIVQFLLVIHLDERIYSRALPFNPWRRLVEENKEKSAFKVFDPGI